MCTHGFCMAASRLGQVHVLVGHYLRGVSSHSFEQGALGPQSLPLSPYKVLSLLVRKGTCLATLQVCLFSG